MQIELAASINCVAACYPSYKALQCGDDGLSYDREINLEYNVRIVGLQWCWRSDMRVLFKCHVINTARDDFLQSYTGCIDAVDEVRRPYHRSSRHSLSDNITAHSIRSSTGQ